MATNLVLRPVQANDIDALVKLAEMAGAGMTNFPPDKAILDAKIERSLQSFAKRIVQQPLYFFVLEDLDVQKIVGCSAILGRAGDELPFFNYKVVQEELVSQQLHLHKSIKTLHLTHDYHYTSELCMLFLAPGYRKRFNGAMLSRLRFLFIANAPEMFSEKLIAEMRGVVSNEGESAFWDAVGAHFFGITFLEADRLSARGEKQFIIDLMPRNPIYVPLLSNEAQAVIGQVHQQTLPALQFLKREGFRDEHYIDIFDAGCAVEAHVADIHTIKNSEVALVGQCVNTLSGSIKSALISTVNMDFRGTLDDLVLLPTDQVIITNALAKRLQLQSGDTIRYIEMRS